MSRFRLKARAYAQNQFRTASISGLTGTVTSGAVTGTPIGEVSVFGYAGTITIEARAGGDSRVAYSGSAFIAGNDPTDYDTDPSFDVPIWVVAQGGMKRPATLTIGVEPLETPIALTLKTTDIQHLDLGSQLATCPDFNMVTVSNEGSVTLCPWQLQTLPPGASREYTKGELLRYLAVSTEAASVSATAGTLTLTYKLGEGETGGTQELDVLIATSNAVSKVHEHGAKNPARWGGYDLRQIDAGPWTLVGQSTAGALEVFDSRVTFAPVGGTAGNVYGTRFLTDPATGVGAYTATVSSVISGEHTISFTVVPNVTSVGPHPAPIPETLGNSQLRTVLRATNKKYGDEVWLEDGEYRVPGDTVGTLGTIVFANAPTQREGGPPAPVNKGDPGWITVRSKNYLGAKFVSKLEVDASTLNAPFVRFCEFELANPSASIRIVSPNGNWNCSDLHLEFIKGVASISNSVKNPTMSGGTMTKWGNHERIHANDIWLTGGTAGLIIRAWDNELIGNQQESATEDSFKCSQANRVSGSKKAKFWFNTVINKKYDDPTEGKHPDLAQFTYARDTLSDLWNHPGEYDAPSMYGNTLMRGEGSYNVSTLRPNRYERDGQGIFCSDPGPDGATWKLDIRACTVSSLMQNGIYWDNAASGSVVDYCTVVPPFDILGEPWCNGASNARVRMEGPEAGEIAVSNCLLAGTPLASGTATFLLENNVTDLSSTGAAVATFADPLTTDDIHDLPQALTKLAVIDPARTDKGAQADPMVNIRHRWVHPSLL